MKIIQNIDDPCIEEFKSLKKLHNDNSEYNKKIFIAEGEKVVLRLLNGDIKILKLLCSEKYYYKHKDLIDLSHIDNLFIADKQLIDQIIGFKMHQAVIAVAAEKPSVLLNELDDIVICTNCIIDSENIGSIIRNGAAFGISSIITDEQSSSPYLRRAVRVSLGNVIDFKHYYSKDILSDLLYLKNKLGYSIISSELTDNSVNIDDFIFPQKFVIVFGNEGFGISDKILNISDAVIKIKIAEKINSINVAASTAIVFYEISKINA